MHHSQKCYLDDFCHAIGKLSRRKRLQKGGIYEDVFGLPKSTDQVLPVGCVNGGLPTDAGIDHSK